MDFGNLLDALIPIIFLVIWVISGIIQATKKKDQDAKPRGRRARRAPSPYQQPEPVARDPIQEIFGEEISRQLYEEELQQEALHRTEQMVEQAKVSQQPTKQQQAERNYLAELEAQRKKAKEALAYKDATLEKHSNQGAYALDRDAYSQDNFGDGQSLRKTVKASLRNNRAAKRAFVMHEILGAPVSLRQEGKMGKSWEL